MGIPNHYSAELPDRCMALIDWLLPVVRGEANVVPRRTGPEAPPRAVVASPAPRYGGPLTTTFLLALATPMILLPIERVLRADEQGEPYIDDRSLDPDLAAAIRAGLGAGPLRNVEFFIPGAWSFAQFDYRGENLADSFPDRFTEALVKPDAQLAAARMERSQWASTLRNALGHGGVFYLDAEGRHPWGGVAEGLAFVSAKYPNRDTKLAPTHLNVLRISEGDFLTFLRRWAQWLKSSGLSQHMAQAAA